MDDVHIFTTKFQPAMRYTVNVCLDPDDSFVVKNPPRRLFWCFRCGRRRWAQNMVVQVYYDGCYFWCRDTAACKAYKKKQGQKRYKRRKASLARRTTVRSGRGATWRSTSKRPRRTM